jgi:uncharacterized repeat protein (TIGR01451 family)
MLAIRGTAVVIAAAWLVGAIHGQQTPGSAQGPPPIYLPETSTPGPWPPAKPAAADQGMTGEIVPVSAVESVPPPAPVTVVPTPAPAAVTEVASGRQEPCVSIELIPPPAVSLHQPATFQLVARNISNRSVQQVVVRYPVPAAVTVRGSDPRALAEGNVLRWDLGTLQPGQEQRIDLQVIPQSKGPLTCLAQVSFTGSTSVQLQVHDPKLVVTAAAPAKVSLGDVAVMTLTASNPGDGAAEQVKVKATLPEGLEHVRGRVVEVELGTLAPRESRSVQLVCVARAAGQQMCQVVASADTGLVARGSAAVEVTLPRIELALAGPKLRYVGRHAAYAFRVTNPGSGPAANVTVQAQIPDGFKFQAASAGGRHDSAARTVTWFLGDLGPGQDREITLELVASALGDHRLHAVATASRGLKAEAIATTRVEGLSALLMELVDLDDPVEVGADTAYEIRVTNTGSKMETNLELVCVLPDKMEFRGAKGADNCRFRVQDKQVIFEALPRLAPRADAVYRVYVRGLAPGDLRFRARIRADGLTEPVLREESTKVYGDDNSAR